MTAAPSPDGGDAPLLTTLGRYPTPAQPIAPLSTGKSELWVKRDDLTHEGYGGNKVRKLERLLLDAKEARATRLVTIGATGSHHVLATTYFGMRAGFEVEAILVPQPRTEGVVETLRAGIALGLRPVPVRSWAAVPAWVVRLTWARGVHFVTVGGSSVSGSMGYVDAARELGRQVRAGQLPEPDVCVVALGSGGTAGGLAAGFAVEGMKTRVIGVCVSEPPWILRLAARWLARACFRRRVSDASTAHDGSRGMTVASRMPLGQRLAMDARFLGKGYGHATPEGDAATRMAWEAAGITLDPTYTAKAFAAALRHVNGGRYRHVLYWHTLSSAPMAPLLEHAPREGDLGAPLQRLLL